MSSMALNAYLAAPLFTPEQQSTVAEMHAYMRRHGYKVFDPLENSQKIWNGRKPSECTAEERAQVLNDNIYHLDCELLVAWVGGWPETGLPDTGVVWELGYFTALKTVRFTGYNRAALVYIDDQDTKQNLNLMLAGTIDAVARGVDELDKALWAYKNQGKTGLVAAFSPSRIIRDQMEPVV